MKKYYVGLVVLFIVALVYQSVSAEVRDLDDLTEGYNANTTTTNTNNANESTPQPVETNTNAAVTPVEPADQALNLAECIIYQRLEIEDARCDKLMAELNCPEYAGYVTDCEGQHQQCLAAIAKQYSSDTYSQCSAFYKSCTDSAVDFYPECSKKFPPRNISGEKITKFNLEDAVGDVRVFYEDNPTPFEMETVTKNRTIQTGAVIFTGESGSATLTLPNGSVQYVGPNTYFRIADYYTSDQLDSIITILKNGNVRVGLDNSGTSQVGYLVLTPLWKVSAKGTEFEVTVNEDGTEAISVTAGLVELASLVGDDELTLTAGETATSDEFGEIVDDNNIIVADGDYTLTSKLQHAWYTYRWSLLGGVALVALIIGLILIIRRRSK